MGTIVDTSKYYFIKIQEIELYKMSSENVTSEKERTFIMVKPDGVQRGLVGEIIKRFEQKGYKLVAMKYLIATEERMKKHYSHLSDKPFFKKLVKYMTSGPVIPMVWEGFDVVKQGRVILGTTNPQDSVLASIRGDFCVSTGRNVCHASDSTLSAMRETRIWFSDSNGVL